MAKKKAEKKSAGGAQLPVPGSANGSIVCVHDPPCADSEGCIRRSMIEAGVGSHRVNVIPGNGSASESREVAP